MIGVVPVRHRYHALAVRGVRRERHADPTEEQLGRWRAWPTSEHPLGDTVTWDNRGVLRATPYAPGSPGEMLRTTVLGDEHIS